MIITLAANAMKRLRKRSSIAVLGSAVLWGTSSAVAATSPSTIPECAALRSCAAAHIPTGDRASPADLVAQAIMDQCGPAAALCAGGMVGRTFAGDLQSLKMLDTPEVRQRDEESLAGSVVVPMVLKCRVEQRQKH
jgi:hypothetical protein